MKKQRAIGKFHISVLSGGWSTQETINMIEEFNKSHHMRDSEKRMLILRRILGARKIGCLIFEDIVTIPKRAHHLDLCAEQFNKAARWEIISKYLYLSFTGNHPNKDEWLKQIADAEKIASEKGELPNSYKRKYPTNPRDISEIDCTNNLLIIEGSLKNGRRIPLEKIRAIEHMFAEKEDIINIRILIH